MAIAEARGEKHPRSIAIINYKGGVGKTTVTYLLGLYLSLETARKVLLIDIDAQCSLSLAVGLEPEESSQSDKNIYHLVKPATWANLHKTNVNEFVQPVPGLPAPLYIVPGAFKVEDLDVEIVETILAQKDRSKHELFLFSRQLLRAFDDFQYILVDCPPNKMYLTQAMLRACNYYIMVTIPDIISTFGMPRLLRWVREVNDVERPKTLGYVINVINRTGGSPAGKVGSQQRAESTLKENLKKDLSRYELAMMEQEPCIGEIPRLDAIARFLGEEKSVRLDFSRKTSGQPTIDQCLRKIATEVLKRMSAYDA